MEEALENLNLALTSPRPRAPGTIAGYLCVARQYLTWLGSRIPPVEKDTRMYFAERRKTGWGEGTLAMLFQALKKLHESNGWSWPFTKDDRPIPPSEPNTPAFTELEVATLIRKRDLYSDGERFHLALSTILAPRREELARVNKKDIKGNTILIHTCKRGPERWHLLPDEIMPVITAYKPNTLWPSALSAMFQRICQKGLGETKKDYGWHSIRRTLDTLGPIALAREGLPLTFWADYMRWSKKSMGARILGSPMAGLYTHPEILSTDRFALDRVILPIHPLLPYWRD